MTQLSPITLIYDQVAIAISGILNRYNKGEYVTKEDILNDFNIISLKDLDYYIPYHTKSFLQIGKLTNFSFDNSNRKNYLNNNLISLLPRIYRRDRCVLYL